MGAESPKKELIVDFHFRAASIVIGDCIGSMSRLRPAEDPIGFMGAHIDTAMAHLLTEIFVPVSAMKCVANRRKEG